MASVQQASAKTTPVPVTEREVIVIEDDEEQQQQAPPKTVEEVSLSLDFGLFV